MIREVSDDARFVAIGRYISSACRCCPPDCVLYTVWPHRGRSREVSLNTSIEWAGLLCAGVLACHQAKATCPIGFPPPTRYVGNMATDHQCTDNDIQSAINAVVCPGATVVISNERTYTAQHLSIAGKSLTLTATGPGIGCGPPPAFCPPTGCAAAPIVPQVTLSGAGQTTSAVIAITGDSYVKLQYLEISGSNRGLGTTGGGISFIGSGALTLDTDTIDNNRATYGAGIDIISPTDATTLTLQPNTLIINNKATNSGGGIRITGKTQLIAVSDATLIGFNSATGGYGGGIAIIGPARADIASGGYFNFGVIYSNTAAYGGGVAAIASPGNQLNARLQMFTTNAAHPVTLALNQATVGGGAIYLKPSESSGLKSFAAACTKDFRIDGNTAPEGSAIYADWVSSATGIDTGGSAYLNDSQVICSPNPPVDLGAVACAPDAPCNEISENTTVGSVFFAGHNAEIHGKNISIRHNNAAHLLFIEQGFLGLEGSLLANNQLSQELLLSEGGDAGLSNCTVAHDVINSAYTLKVTSNADFTLQDDIIDEADTLLVDQLSGATVYASNILSNDITTLPVNATIIHQDPLFVNAAAGNYHLRAFTQNGAVTASQAIDFAPTSPLDISYDLDGNPYGIDVPAVANAYGKRDLGAYEAQPITDRIFADAFGDPVSLVMP